MFCIKCGNRVNDGEEFCSQCGAKLTGDETEASQESAAGQQAADAAETEQHEVFDDTVKGEGKWSIIADFGGCFLRIVSTLIGMIGLLELISYSFDLEISSWIYWSFGCVIVVGNLIMTIFRNRENIKISRAKGLFICGIIAAAAICIVIFGAVNEDSGRNRSDSDKYVRMVKTATLEAYPQKTVGDAFDGYLKNPKWESGLSEDGIRFVNVSGKILIYGKETDIVVQFVINDEKAGIFFYNACELNGVPQNDLFVWGLLEVVYNENSVSGDPNFGDGTSVAESDTKIVIGETQSVNNNDENMEVTLDSIEFREGKFNISTPNEGCVWLVATITVKNVGTKDCSLPGVKTLIYDGVYEYNANYFTEGDSLSWIAPLTEPKTQSIAFMVPKIVEESEKSLVLNIGDWENETMLSYTIRQGEGTTSGINSNNGSSEISRYEGEWSGRDYDRIFMEINYVDADGGYFDITISWSSSAAEWTQWELRGVYMEEGVMQYVGNQIEYGVAYETGEIEGTVVSETEEGSLWFGDDGLLYWDDYTEPSGESYVLERSTNGAAS